MDASAPPPAPPPAPPLAPRPRWIRFAPAALALGAIAAAWGLGLFRLLSFEVVRENRAALTLFVADHHGLALLAFFAVYVAATALALPGALWITVAGGFLFGAPQAAAVVTVAATLGAVIVFLIARATIEGAREGGLAARARPFLARMEQGFKADEAFYLLTLRLLPIVPYFIANIAPAFLGARLSVFAWTTFLGIIPGVVAYAWIGGGLGAVLDAGGAPDIAALSRAILPPLAALAALPLLAILVRRLGARRRRA